MANDETKGLSGYGDMVTIQHRHISDSVDRKKDFVTLEINLDKSLHWEVRSNARWGQLVVYLENEAQIQEILAIAFASARGCEEGRGTDI